MEIDYENQWIKFEKVGGKFCFDCSFQIEVDPTIMMELTPCVMF